MALSQSIANGAPVIPDEVAFWEHAIHYTPERFYGGSTDPGDSWYLTQNCSTQHRSSIRSDTKFWMRGKDGVQLATFRELDSSIKEGTNFFMPEVGVSCGTWDTDIIGKSNNGNPYSLGQRINLNVSSLQDYDSYTIWNQAPAADSIFTPDDNLLPAIQYSSSHFAYKGGALQKVYYNEDPMSFIPMLFSDTTTNYYNETSGLFLSFPHSFQNQGKYMPAQRIVQIVFSEHGLQLGSHNCFTTASGTNNPLNLPTGATIHEAVKNAINHYTDQINCTSATATAIRFKMQMAKTGRYDNAADILIGSRIHNNGATVSESIIDKLFEITGSWATGSVSGDGNQYSYDIMEKYLWNGYSERFFYGAGSTGSLQMDAGYTAQNVNITGSVTIQNSPYGGYDTCYQTRRSIVQGQNNGVTSGGTAFTQSHGFNSSWIIAQGTTSTGSSIAWEYNNTFDNDFNTVVKMPTCTCIPIQQWSSLPAHKESYELTFDDGYTFTAGALLKLFSYNPHYLESTGSWYTTGTNNTQGEPIPRSKHWARDLSSRTPHEIFRTQENFHGYDGIHHLNPLTTAPTALTSTDPSGLPVPITILNDTSVRFDQITGTIYRAAISYTTATPLVIGQEYRLRFTVSDYIRVSNTGSLGNTIVDSMGFASNIGTDPFAPNGGLGQDLFSPGPGKVRGNGDYEVIFQCANSTAVEIYAENCVGTISNINLQKTIVPERQAFIKCADVAPGTTDTAGYTFLTDIKKIDGDVGELYPENWYKPDLKAGYSRPHFTINNNGKGLSGSAAGGYTLSASFSQSNGIFATADNSCSINCSTMTHFTEVSTKNSNISQRWDDLISGWLMLENGLHVAFAECDMNSGADPSCGPGGCMDSTACNYDANATWDNGSCHYRDGCTGGFINSATGLQAASVGPYPDVNGHGRNAVYNCATSTTVPITPDPIQFTASSVAGYHATNYSPCANCQTSCCFIGGCTTIGAANYNPLACYDDGTCDIPGCMDPTTSNYNPLATWDDGSCFTKGCMDPLALNWDPDADSPCNTSCYQYVSYTGGSNASHPGGCCCITCQDHEWTFNIERPDCDGLTYGAITASIGTSKYGGNVTPGQISSFVTYSWYQMDGTLLYREVSPTSSAYNTSAYGLSNYGLSYNDEIYITTTDYFGCTGLTTFTMPCLSWRCEPAKYTSDDCQDRFFTGTIATEPYGATAYFSSHSIGRTDSNTFDQVPFTHSFSNFKYIDTTCATTETFTTYQIPHQSPTRMNLFSQSNADPYTPGLSGNHSTNTTAIPGSNYLWKAFDQSISTQVPSNAWPGSITDSYDFRVNGPPTAYYQGAYIEYDFGEHPQKLWKQKVWSNHYDASTSTNSRRVSSMTMSCANSHSWGIGGGEVYDVFTFPTEYVQIRDAYSQSNGEHKWHELETFDEADYGSGQLLESTYSEPTSSHRYYRIHGITSNFANVYTSQAHVRINEWEMFPVVKLTQTASSIDGGTCKDSFGCYAYIDHIVSWHDYNDPAVTDDPSNVRQDIQYHYDWGSFVTRVHAAPHVHGWQHWDDSYLELSMSVHEFDYTNYHATRLHWDIVTGSCNCVGIDCGCVQDNTGTLPSCGAGEPCCAGLTGSLRVSCSTTPVDCHGGGRIDCIISGVGYNQIPTTLPIVPFQYNVGSSSMPDVVQAGGGGNQVFGTLNQNEQSLLSTTAIGSAGFTASVFGTNIFASASQQTFGTFSFQDVPLGGNWTASFMDTTLGTTGDSTWQYLTIGNYDVPELVVTIREGLSGSGITAPGSLYDPSIINPQGCVNASAGISASFDHVGNAQAPLSFSWETIGLGNQIIDYAPGSPVVGTNRDVMEYLTAPLSMVRSKVEDANGCVIFSPWVDIPCSLEPRIGCQNPDAENYFFPANSESCMCEPPAAYISDYPAYTFTHNVRHENPSVANSGKIMTTVQHIATNNNLPDNTTNFVSWSVDHSGGTVVYQQQVGDPFNIYSAGAGVYTLTASNCFNGVTSDQMLFSSSVTVQSLEVQGCMDPTDPSFAFEANSNCCCTCTYATPGHYLQGINCTTPGNGQLKVYISGGQGTGNVTLRLKRSTDGGNTYQYFGGQVSVGTISNGLAYTFTGLGAGAIIYYKVEVNDANGCPAIANAAINISSTNNTPCKIFKMNGC